MTTTLSAARSRLMPALQMKKIEVKIRIFVFIIVLLESG
jgi:hypothetical protein